MNMQKKFKCGVVYILAFVVFFTNIPMSVQAVEHESMEIDVKDNIWEGDVAKKFDSGDGTVSNPYIISNGAELRYFADEITNGENFYNKYIDILFYKCQLISENFIDTNFKNCDLKTSHFEEVKIFGSQ